MVKLTIYYRHSSWIMYLLEYARIGTAWRSQCGWELYREGDGIWGIQWITAAASGWIGAIVHTARSSGLSTIMTTITAVIDSAIHTNDGSQGRDNDQRHNQQPNQYTMFWRATTTTGSGIDGGRRLTWCYVSLSPFFAGVDFIVVTRLGVVKCVYIARRTICINQYLPLLIAVSCSTRKSIHWFVWLYIAIMLVANTIDSRGFAGNFRSSRFCLGSECRLKLKCLSSSHRICDAWPILYSTVLPPVLYFLLYIYRRFRLVCKMEKASLVWEVESSFESNLNRDSEHFEESKMTINDVILELKIRQVRVPVYQNLTRLPTTNYQLEYIAIRS